MDKLESGLYHTLSGSTYELDLENKRIRRAVRSEKSEAERPGNGEWVPYEAIHYLPNKSLLIGYNGIQGAMTSKVIRFEKKAS
jgi:hypothetical protein